MRCVNRSGVQWKLMLGKEHRAWLADLAEKLRMTESDVVRDLILSAHAKLDRGELVSIYDEDRDRRIVSTKTVHSARKLLASCR